MLISNRYVSWTEVYHHFSIWKITASALRTPSVPKPVVEPLKAAGLDLFGLSSFTAGKIIKHHLSMGDSPATFEDEVNFGELPRVLHMIDISRPGRSLPPFQFLQNPEMCNASANFPRQAIQEANVVAKDTGLCWTLWARFFGQDLALAESVKTDGVVCPWIIWISQRGSYPDHILHWRSGRSSRYLQEGLYGFWGRGCCCRTNGSSFGKTQFLTLPHFDT